MVANTLNSLKLTGFPVERALKVVRHEVGHWVVGYYHGFKVGDIKITIVQGGHNGEASVNLESDLRSLDLVTRYLERRISVLCAGVLAESLGHDGKTNRNYAGKELTQGGGTNDYKAIRELVRVLRGIKHGPPSEDLDKLQRQLEQVSDEIWDQTIQIVEDNHEVIDAITRAIMQQAVRLNVEFGMRAPIIRKLPEFKRWAAKLPKRV